ncbi:hypothetical protein Q5Y75_26985 [Ruegeria sp. 2205SS24-7]|uniref:hypothetical protein n=1 Tax=Ruegeria discodermiae TaxID=3064389 RepID=UPI00274173D3|nr:hypothetical protein [Ruegeria sp. 2205SS24-7]MDP5220837.1 hypothetical protein [Ruegeria sp. 2205SS24-7]
MTKLTVHIDRLVLPEGVAGHDVTEALRAALSRETSRNGTALDKLHGTPSRAHLDAGRVPASSGSAGLGRAITQAVLSQAPAKGRSNT